MLLLLLLPTLTKLAAADLPFLLITLLQPYWLPVVGGGRQEKVTTVREKKWW